MGETQLLGVITKEFLENALKRKVEKYFVSSGSKAGDNYSSTMYSIEVHFQDDSSIPNNESNSNEEKTPLYVISKCYPNSPSRQVMLVEMNAFHKELSYYTVFVPELLKMQKELNLEKIIQPAYPEVVAGYARNFDEEKYEEGKVYKPFDNYIMMVDLRKTFGFTLAERMKGYDRAHVSLVMNAMAKNHALGWIYKQKHNITDIKTKFPFIDNDYSNKCFDELLTDIAVNNGNHCYKIVANALGESSPVAQGTKKFVDNIRDMLLISYGPDGDHLKYRNVHRVNPDDGDDNNNNDIPWKLVIQGDCWTNNMLFRYNEVTGEPEDVILVDLQLAREACPTADLSYSIYASTDAEFRRNHLDDMLELYAEKFLYYCKLMKTEPLPGFSVQEFKRRFHLAKPFGFCFALLGLPLMLKSEINPEDLESEGKTISDMINSICSEVSDEDVILKERVVGVCQDMYNDGII